MNTYNENLRSSVVASLQDQGLEQKQVASKLNASIFTLYYAEGATVSAAEKLEASQADLNSKALVKKQAVDNSNLSINLLSSATQAGNYSKQCNTNTSVSAANVNIAANAIVKLAGDIGSIYSIVNSTDFGKDIYHQTKDAHRMMNHTAYAAEVASQYAMEASIGCAAVSAATVLDKSKATNALMANMLKTVSADFDTASQLVSTNNATLATASATEKAAEGNFEDISVDYKATAAAYNSINSGLNMNLRVPADSVSATGFTVKFRPLTSAFDPDLSNPFYPVQDYYVMVVKESKQFTFSVSQADYIMTNAPRQIIAVPLPPGPMAQPSGPAPPSTTGNSALIPLVQPIELPVLLNMQDANGPYTLKDSDGDDVTTGVDYVVYVMAVYLDQYKKAINVFDDFLSAPSASFTLTTQLNPATDIVAAQLTNATVAEEAQAAAQATNGKASDFMDSTFKVTFNTNDNPDFAVEYRCMFLPLSSDLTRGLLTQDSIESLNSEIEALEDIAAKYDPEIEALEAQLAQSDQSQQDADNNGGAPQLDVNAAKTRLATLQQQRQEAISSLPPTGKSNQIGFLFNTALAEQVSPANYSLPYRSGGTTPPAKQTKASKNADPAPEGDSGNPYTSWALLVGPQTTDNFGNPLAEGKSYLPVVLTASTEEEQNLAKFVNVLSDFNAAASFVYSSSLANSNQ